MGEHAGRPDHQHGVPERGVFVLARDQAVARREGQLHRVRKADHMISGVITFKNILRLKLAHPRPPSASKIAIIGGKAATTMNDILRKKMIAMMQPARIPRML